MRFGATGITKSLLTGLKYPHALAADDKYLYFGEAFAGPQMDQGYIERLEKPADENANAGAKVIVNNAGRPRGIAVDLQHVYWFDWEQVQDAMMKYWVRVQRAGKAALNQPGGADIVAEIEGSAISDAVLVDSSFVYWTSSSALMRRPKDLTSGLPVTLLTTAQYGDYNLRWFVQDRARLYATKTDNSRALIFWVAK